MHLLADLAELMCKTQDNASVSQWASLLGAPAPPHCSYWASTPGVLTGAGEGEGLVEGLGEGLAGLGEGLGLAGLGEGLGLAGLGEGLAGLGEGEGLAAATLGVHCVQNHGRVVLAAGTRTPGAH
jgi:hypothetical protein